MIGVVSIVVFYSLIQIVAQSTLGTELINQKAPLAAVAGTLLGNWASTMLIVCAVVAIFGSLNSLVLVFSRVVYAGARDGLLPRFLSKVHPKFATPHVALISFSTLSLIAAISGGFKQLIILATLSVIFLHIGVALSVIKFRLKPGAESPGSFNLPGGISIPLIALGALLWFLFQSKANEVMALAIFVVVLSIVYALKTFVYKQQ